MEARIRKLADGKVLTASQLAAHEGEAAWVKSHHSKVNVDTRLRALVEEKGGGCR